MFNPRVLSYKQRAVSAPASTVWWLSDMKSLRILLVDGASPLREAIARALSFGGHQVKVAEPGGGPNDFDPDAVVYGEGAAEAGGAGTERQIRLRRPINMEELRRALRDD
jgi:hypothetical protein